MSAPRRQPTNYFTYFTEFFHTERSHVRNLKVLDRLFFRPLRDSMTMSGELTERLFPNLEEVLTVHLSFSQKMKERIKGGYPIGKIGDILSDMVSRLLLFSKKLRYSDRNKWIESLIDFLEFDLLTWKISVWRIKWRLPYTRGIGVYQKSKVVYRRAKRQATQGPQTWIISCWSRKKTWV